MSGVIFNTDGERVAHEREDGKWVCDECQHVEPEKHGMFWHRSHTHASHD